MSQAYVTLEKYTADVTQLRNQLFYSSEKIRRIGLLISNQLNFLESLDSSTSGLFWIKSIHAALGDILKIERLELVEPPIEPLEKSLDKIKFSSIADGVQTRFEFEGER